MGLMCALAVALSFLEGLLPPLVPVPGVKLGLSNVVVMYAVFVLGPRYALTLALLKALFAGLLRGFMAGVLAGCGGIASVTIMLLLLWALQTRASYVTVSVAGAVTHNLGQLACAGVLLQVNLFYYLPVLLASGVGMGILTAILLRVVLPYLPGK